jgi:PAS domain-containing protein
VWQWQLIVGFSTVAVALGVTLLNPRLFGDISLLTGLALICAITSWAMVMPWARHRELVLALPFADAVAIGLLAISDHTLGYLWVVPMAWVATYYSMAAVVAALGLIFALQIVRWWIPGAPLTSPLEIMIVLLGLGFLGIAMNQGARRTRAFRLLIQRQSRQLDRAVARMSVHEDRANGLFDTVSTALARVDDRGNIDLANAAYRHLYAYDNDDYRHPPRAVEYDAYRGTALPATRPPSPAPPAASGSRTS